MICIFSTSVDLSTNEVIRWLHHLGAHDVLRVNADEPEPAARVTVIDDTLHVRLPDGREVTLASIEAVWYRKGRHWWAGPFPPVSIAGRPALSASMNARLRAEQLKLSEFLHVLIAQHVPCLGSPPASDPNKLLVLRMAREEGLSVPAWCVSNSAEHLHRFVAGQPSITKPMSDGLYFFDAAESGQGYFSYTEEAAASDVAGLSGVAPPSFLQRQIEKLCDVRVFFLEGRCHAMAILSQDDEQTRVDFRRYNDEKPNRSVPMNLPADVEAKLARLFARLELNTGSVDLVLDRAHSFHFLEINPVGQFGMVSKPCNSLLEREVARTLLTYAGQAARAQAHAS